MAQEFLKLHGDIPNIQCSGFSEIIGAEHVIAAGVREFMRNRILPDVGARAVRRAPDGDA